MFDIGSLFRAAAENVSFILVSIVVFIVLFLIAMAVERFCLKPVKQTSARRAAYIGIFSAVAAVLMYFEISLPFAPPFYQIDLSEVPVLICSFSLGPVAGVVSELVKIILKLLLKGTSTAFVGDFANFVVGCSFVLPATIVYHRFKTKKGALAGMGIGTGIMTVFGSLFNAIYLIPTFAVLFEMPLDVIISMGTSVNSAITSVTTMVLFAVVPFNLIKGVVVSVITLLLYKRIERLLKMR